MFKRSIKTFILCFVLSLMCVLSVNAASLESIVEPGDIIIGNTVFRSDDWISASRSSKAGALYAMNTGETEVRVFYYDDFEDWYEYNDTTSKYELITEPTLSELGDVIDIYYDNNKPLMNTYESYAEFEEGEEFPVDSNDVFHLFWMFGDSIKVEDDNVKFDFDNQTITCTYGYTFDFQLEYEEEGEVYSDNFKGICSIEEFTFEDEEYYNYEKLGIENIELVSVSEDENLINQDKVTLNYNDRYYNHAGIFVNEELEETLPSLAAISSTYVAVDIKLKGDSNYELVHDIDEAYSIIKDKNSIRLYLTAKDYGYNVYTITLFDLKYKTFEEIYIYFDGFNQLDYDLTLENVINGTSAFDEGLQNNNDTIRSIDVQNDELYREIISVNMVGELMNSSFNDYQQNGYH